MAVGRREWISPLQKTIVLTILIVILIATSDIALCARRSGRSRARMGSFRRGRPVRWVLQSRNGGTRSISKTSGAIFARRMQRFKFPFHIANGKTGNVGRVRTDTISEPVIHHFDLARLINPHNPFVGITNWKKTLESSEQDMSYLKGFRRKRRLYCRAGKGFHLEIKKNGKVRARHVATNDSVMEVFSVKPGVVGIKSFTYNRYLCMNRKGKLFTKKIFKPQCEFRENFEKNKYNSYASELYSDHKRRKGYFLAVSKSGRLKRGRKVSWRQKRAHWLALQVRDG